MVVDCNAVRATLGHGPANTPNNAALDALMVDLNTLLAALKVWTTLTGA
jgi:hypothetical protein